MSKVQLRFMEMSDAERLFEILTNPNFTHFGSTPKTMEEELNWLKGVAQGIADGTSYSYAIIFDGELVGGIGVKIFAHRTYVGEIGYFLDEKLWGQGIVVEAVKLLEENCFSNFGLTRLEAVMQPENIASEKVAIKSGYHKEGFLKNVLKDREGNLKDVYLYAKTKNDSTCGENCNDLYTACKKCYTEFREWQLASK